MPGIFLGTGNSNEQGRCGPCLNRDFILVEKTDNKQLHSDLKTVTINAKMMKSTVLVEHRTLDLTGSGSFSSLMPPEISELPRVTQQLKGGRTRTSSSYLGIL